MEQTKSQNLPGILVSLEFQKAFDSLEWSFIRIVLPFKDQKTADAVWHQLGDLNRKIKSKD